MAMGLVWEFIFDLEIIGGWRSRLVRNRPGHSFTLVINVFGQLKIKCRAQPTVQIALDDLMAQVGWIRLAVPVETNFCMFLVDLCLLGTTSDDDHALSSHFLDDLYECASKTTSELVQHLISTDKLLAFSSKPDSVAVFASVRIYFVWSFSSSAKSP